jgi:hypothetical protein
MKPGGSGTTIRLTLNEPQSQIYSTTAILKFSAHLLFSANAVRFQNNFDNPSLQLTSNYLVQVSAHPNYFLSRPYSAFSRVFHQPANKYQVFWNSLISSALIFQFGNV